MKNKFVKLYRLKFVGENYIIVNKRISKLCTFLDNKGLCNIVRIMEMNICLKVI